MDFEMLYFYKDSPIFLEKAKIIDHFKNEDKEAYLLKFLTPDCKLYYGIFGAKGSPTKTFRSFPADIIAIYDDEEKAKKTFDLFKSYEPTIKTRHFRRSDLQHIAELINNLPLDDPIEFLNRVYREIDSLEEIIDYSGRRILEKIRVNVKKYVMLAIRLRKQKGEKLYCVETDLGERYVFAENITQAILKATANLTSVEKVYEVDEYFNKTPIDTPLERAKTAKALIGQKAMIPLAQGFLIVEILDADDYNIKVKTDLGEMTLSLLHYKVEPLPEHLSDLNVGHYDELPEAVKADTSS